MRVNWLAGGVNDERERATWPQRNGCLLRLGQPWPMGRDTRDFDCQPARGKYVIMGDADDSYDFSNVFPFLEKLRTGYDLVLGNRFRGGIKPGAMPPLHRYFGNPLLTAIGRLFFRGEVGDFYCGLRGF